MKTTDLREFWARLAGRSPAAADRGEAILAQLLVLLAWAVTSLPNLSLRSFMFEEGRNAVVARDIVEHGNWLAPYIFGLRWAEKPQLLSWAAAALAPLTGGINEWSMRLPVMIAVLATALMIQQLTRRHAGLGASLFAAANYLFCPVMLTKLTDAEPDTMVVAFSFGAFMLWWGGEERGRVGLWRWLGCALLVTLVALTKGPQPVGFFGLGVGLYLLLHRRWRQLPALILALLPPAVATAAWAAAVYQPGDMGNWMRYMRMNGQLSVTDYVNERLRLIGSVALEWLPSTVLLPVAAALGWRGWSVRRAPPVVQALLCYGGAGAAALLLWPGTGSRYAMPIGPALTILAAFAAEALWLRRAWIVRLAVGIVGATFLYQLAIATVAMPLMKHRFGASRETGLTISRAIQADPAPVYCLLPCEPTRLFYVETPIQTVFPPEYKSLAVPAWLLATRDTLAPFLAVRPDLSVSTTVEVPTDPRAMAVRLQPK